MISCTSGIGLAWLLLQCWTVSLDASNSAAANVNNGGAETTWSMPLLSAKQMYQRKLEEQQQRRGESLPTSQLYQGYGTHYVDLWVGTPIPQRQTVIVDTGSSVTAFPCKGCHECGFDDSAEYHTDRYFDPSLSTTFKKTSCGECRKGICSGGECTLRMAYAEGSSWNAYEASDNLYVGGPHSHADAISGDSTNNVETSAATFEMTHTFGCQTSLTGLFRTQLADGIMLVGIMLRFVVQRLHTQGMSNEPNTFWEQVHRSGKVTKKQFSLCFGRQDYVDSNGTPAGAMTIGGYDERLHNSPMVFAEKVSTGSSFYTVHIKKIYLKKSTVNNKEPMVTLPLSESQINEGHVILDSGTTDSYFASAVGDAFKATWKEMTGKPYSNEALQFDSKDDLLALPTVVLQMKGASKEYYEAKYGGSVPFTSSMLAGEDLEPESSYDVIVTIPPSHYMEYDTDSDRYTPRLYFEKGHGTILGANAMQGHDILFDMENNYIGFAESYCNYGSLLADNNQITPTTKKAISSSKEEITDDLSPIDISIPTEESATTEESSAEISVGNGDNETPTEESSTEIGSTPTEESSTEVVVGSFETVEDLITEINVGSGDDEGSTSTEEASTEISVGSGGDEGSTPTEESSTEIPVGSGGYETGSQEWTEVSTPATEESSAENSFEGYVEPPTENFGSEEYNDDLSAGVDSSVSEDFPQDDIEEEILEEEYYKEYYNVTLVDFDEKESSKPSDDNMEDVASTSTALAPSEPHTYLSMVAIVILGIVVGSIIMYRRSRSQADNRFRGGRMQVRNNEFDFYDDDDDELEGVEIMNSSNRGRII